MTVNVEDVLLYAIAQRGDRYVYGAEAGGQQANPGAFDCSELVQWSCARAGLAVPDGAANQFAWCRNAGTLIPVADALKIRGALMFPYPDVHHVVFSLGDRTTIEAKGAKWGVGTFSAVDRFQRAALIPGVEYKPRKPLPPAPAPMSLDEEDMPVIVSITPPWAKAIAAGPLRGRFPKLEARPTDGNPREVTVFAVNEPKGQPRQIKMVKIDGEFAEMPYVKLTTTGGPTGASALADGTIVLECEGGGTYKLATKA